MNKQEAAAYLQKHGAEIAQMPVPKELAARLRSTLPHKDYAHELADLIDQQPNLTYSALFDFVHTMQGSFDHVIDRILFTKAIIAESPANKLQ